MVKENISEKIYTPIRATIFMFLGLVILLATGCTPLHKEVIPTIQAEPIYDQLYPYYVEVCAVSQIRAKFTEYGGSGGHAVMYLKGACRDTQAEYPTIEVCDAGTVDLSDPETGVGARRSPGRRRPDQVARDRRAEGLIAAHADPVSVARDHVALHHGAVRLPRGARGGQPDLDPERVAAITTHMGSSPYFGVCYGSCLGHEWRALQTVALTE